MGLEALYPIHDDDDVRPLIHDLPPYIRNTLSEERVRAAGVHPGGSAIPEYRH